MIVYFAGAESTKHQDIAYDAGARNFLYSFFWLGNHSAEIKKLKQKNNEVRIFLDSGGYSARKSGVEVDIESYHDFLETNKDLFTVAVNLDVMDLEQSDKNQAYLETAFPVLPVYHAQEFVEGKTDLFIEMCKKYKYICLGGVAGVAEQKKILTNFFRFCFKHAIANKVKIHGLGITTPELLLEYPFYSVDSTTWLAGGRYGQMIAWDDHLHRFKTIHYLERDKMLNHNVPINTTGVYDHRLDYSVREMLKMERDITRVWKVRGIDVDSW